MDYEHSRMSLGAELKGSAFDINANKYWAITGAKTAITINKKRRYKQTRATLSFLNWFQAYFLNEKFSKFCVLIFFIYMIF